MNTLALTRIGTRLKNTSTETKIAMTCGTIMLATIGFAIDYSYNQITQNRATYRPAARAVFSKLQTEEIQTCVKGTPITQTGGDSQNTSSYRLYQLQIDTNDKQLVVASGDAFGLDGHTVDVSIGMVNLDSPTIVRLRINSNELPNMTLVDDTLSVPLCPK